jgi:hypothetical protein
VVGGSIAKSWDLVQPPLAAGLAGRATPAVCQASGLEEAPILGAALAATRAP